jgi:hypothetical protein
VAASDSVTWAVGIFYGTRSVLAISVKKMEEIRILSGFAQKIPCAIVGKD